MGAQLVRLNAIASNLANADNIASSPEEAYKPAPNLQLEQEGRQDGWDGCGQAGGCWVNSG